jgi:uncharacterized membrane protein YidH (DUF202 family)
VTRHRHGTSLSTPLSTKIVVVLGVGLVLLGFGVAGWQRLSPDDDKDQASTTAQTAQQYLPDVRTVVAYLAVIVVVILAGAFLLVRSRPRRAGY